MITTVFCCRCECRPGFNGHRCQQTHHSFNGDSWAWFKPLAQCEESHTSIEFITTRENGLILYNGPMRSLEPGEQSDFILLELKQGYPQLRINHGSGEAKLSINGKDGRGDRSLTKLNDGRWHRVDIYRKGRVSDTHLTWALIQYKDVLQVQEIPLWWSDDFYLH